jgi:hypothetical protein
MDAVLDSFLPLRDAALSERRRIMDDEANKLKAKPVHQCPNPKFARIVLRERLRSSGSEGTRIIERDEPPHPQRR